ncbi:hypothetical protein [Thalassospira marina]|uniref:Uncharacterized protein n=1 Tax=Thalassospira marina TaxID=2048283 RepID=A0A2N3KIN2_9PROT|nr:hypothetical protein [Thalassospira marina]PKR50404.1 hypothetical protein COO20_21230 [Thalassospira marina]
MSTIVALDDGTKAQSNHKGVTEQFFVGFIAINVYFFLHFIDDENFKGIRIKWLMGLPAPSNP